MKKSKMIEEIVSVIRDTYLLPDRSIAKAILAKIEALGMKPPVEDVCPVTFTTRHVWEKEDGPPSEQDS